MTKTNFILFYSNTCQTASNQFYPNEIQISSENDLKMLSVILLQLIIFIITVKYGLKVKVKFIVLYSF